MPDAATAIVLVGILMPALNATVLLAAAATALIWFTCLDWVKVWLFRRLDLR